MSIMHKKQRKQIEKIIFRNENKGCFHKRPLLQRSANRGTIQVEVLPEIIPEHTKHEIFVQLKDNKKTASITKGQLENYLKYLNLQVGEDYPLQSIIESDIWTFSHLAHPDFPDILKRWFFAECAVILYLDGDLKKSDKDQEKSLKGLFSDILLKIWGEPSGLDQKNLSLGSYLSFMEMAHCYNPVINPRVSLKDFFFQTFRRSSQVPFLQEFLLDRYQQLASLYRICGDRLIPLLYERRLQVPLPEDDLISNIILTFHEEKMKRFPQNKYFPKYQDYTFKLESTIFNRFYPTPNRLQRRRNKIRAFHEEFPEIEYPVFTSHQTWRCSQLMIEARLKKSDQKTTVGGDS